MVLSQDGLLSIPCQDVSVCVVPMLAIKYLWIFLVTVSTIHEELLPSSSFWKHCTLLERKFTANPPNLLLEISSSHLSRLAVIEKSTISGVKYSSLNTVNTAIQSIPSLTLCSISSKIKMAIDVLREVHEMTPVKHVKPRGHLVSVSSRPSFY